MKDYKYLYHINSPKDLKQLKEEQLPELCAEIRTFLLDELSRNPGHLGAGLGVVELTVALHYVFDLPDDKLVWDVGHQAYPHKILTGRRDNFHTLRKWGGLSGFTHPAESEYDAFVAGHASNSISAALGLAVADRLAGKDNQVVAVIGDGAMTGGLAFEGLNNACTHPNNLLIVLNDNNMSIDESTGALSRYLVDIITSKTYNKVRHEGYKTLKNLNLIDEKRRSSILRFNNSLKALLSDRHNLFEGFSIRYIGPVDGHDIQGLVRVLRDIKDFDGPKLLHIQTVKGKGYAPAEESAVVWHAPGCFDVETGQIKAKVPLPDDPMKFQDVFGHTLVELADMDERVVGVTPAMPSGCSMTYLMKKYPDRSFDVGIAEGHAVTFSAGMALQGAIPFCNVYSSFMQRGYDQVIHDAAMQSAPVIFCLDRGGLVGEDGMTHHGVYDIPYLRCIPGLTLMSPYDEEELRMMMYTAYKHHEEGPFVIRYPRGTGSCPHWRTEFRELPLGKAEIKRQGSDIVFVSYGPLGSEVSKVVSNLVEKGYDPGHVNLRFVKPLDEELLLGLTKTYKHVITIEDGALMGGMGSAVLELFSTHGAIVPVTRWGIPDTFVKQGRVDIQHEHCGLDIRSMETKALEILQNARTN
ncbi:1-deoxy-D-xylulose-5-phosphate synthase [Porphyromonas cangingivalis]|uniref:1-deoxy-D-xylulose-5-phosphate synthase n=1 Tax=Porphyromonas cangingivalis TaxID=36874 RepID=UPI0024311559|nr:1-deoxy-D-xylulose-5-phosphate synthase [Porphyromonas cangingivalis]